VIRDIIVEVQVPSTAIYLSLVSGERSVNLIRQPLAAAGIVHLELRQRMEGGDYLQLYVADAPWSVAVTGYQLQLQ